MCVDARQAIKQTSQDSRNNMMLVCDVKLDPFVTFLPVCLPVFLLPPSSIFLLTIQAFLILRHLH